MNRRQLTLALSLLPSLLASAIVTLPTLVVAQNKPITIVVPYPAGGPLDISARILADGARSKLDTTVVVENKPGAGGTIGANQVAKSAAGSQQLLMGAIATHAANPWLMPNYPFDPIKDFKPVTLVAQIPNVLVMHVEEANQLRIRSTRDLLA